jgi:hypothetical protein
MVTTMAYEKPGSPSHLSLRLHLDLGSTFTDIFQRSSLLSFLHTVPWLADMMRSSEHTFYESFAIPHRKRYNTKTQAPCKISTTTPPIQ